MDMNNKPVAWMSNDSFEISTMQSDKFSIPLYTSPAKELTDEEIEECYWGNGYPDNPRHPKEFAYAILRKAQEK